jgi:hypothetical protein
MLYSKISRYIFVKEIRWPPFQNIFKEQLKINHYDNFQNFILRLSIRIQQY